VLALERAQAVQAQLVALGVPADEISISSQGESAPQSTTDQRLNRRVVIALQASPQVSLGAPAAAQPSPGS
jgi:outer membrane protein OmpA-like peptidoglycan-associated protein